MNPITLAKEIEERYRRYLKTTFYFRDPFLRASFEAALDSGRLAKGPYLRSDPNVQEDRSAAHPLHRTSRSQAGARIPGRFTRRKTSLSSSRGLNPQGFRGTQSRGRHRNGQRQDRIISLSDPTSFDREFESRTLCPGIRALVLYPMNALANDQRERLGEICKRLKSANSAFRFTFGQYIGETPENENDPMRKARDQLAERDRKGYSVIQAGQVVHGELVLRSEMRSTPPHILLTNYSMLEYLLLRPDDSPLFDDGRARWWTFLVLDEAHQYRGARGIEMAMLLRRLKQRLKEGGRHEPFRCVATSATLAAGDQDKPSVAKFAADLFGEPFDKQDVILGDVEPISPPGMGTLNQEDYVSTWSALEGVVDGAERLRKLAPKLGVPASDTEENTRLAARLLLADRRATRLRQLVTDSSDEVRLIADKIFDEVPESERIPALSQLVDLLLRLKDPESNDPASAAPLLSARYHLFLRSLEGAFLSFLPNKRILLDRRAADQAALFETGLCRECGQHYIVGRITKDDKLTEAIRDPGRPDFGATFFLPIEDQAAFDTDDEGQDDIERYRLCVRCSEIRRCPDQLKCNHDSSILLLKQAGAEEREDQVPRCAVCGYQAPDPVREVVHGTDGPHAVIATTLYQSLPESRRKVLAFADGRQEAAFFAWYLEDSYKDILGRNLLLKVVQEQGGHSQEGSSAQDLATGLRDIYRCRGVFAPATSDLQLRREAWVSFYREFLTDEPRISLEGVGLVRWALRWPDWLQIPTALTTAPWSLSEREALDVILLLLDSMRADRGVELHCDNTVNLTWSDLHLQAAQMRFRIGPPRKPKGVRSWPVRSWDGKSRRRVRLLAKLLTRLQPGRVEEPDALMAAADATRSIWETIRQCDERAPSSTDRLLIPVNDARRINPDWWRLRPIGENDLIYRCGICGRIQTVSVRAVCPRHRCPGTLYQVRRGELEPNHYRMLYETVLPGSLRVEEHTAQLDKEKAREFQREFRDGKIHVLSCSTTFELGVDLGDLDTIFLRNVPPEAFNYAQRVGRAGRRSGFPGFAITYCRRGPHDLYHFSEPQRMLNGKVQAPVLALRNEKIVTRHVAAVALSLFFRAHLDRFRNVEGLLKNPISPCAVADFRTFVLSNRPSIEETIRCILPAEIVPQFNLSDGAWIDRVAGESERFALAEAEVSSDYKTVIVLEESARSQRDYRTAEWAQRRAETIAKEEVLSFLSRKAVIPKYGFPVDVVELDTQRTLQSQESFEVSLQRDLSIAISEFAPTSKLVANKKEWTSYGLKKVAEREWPRKLYARCQAHNVFLLWKKGEPEPVMPCGDRLRAGRYIIPQFGFVTDKAKPKEPTARPRRVFSTRPYFGSALGPEPGLIPMPSTSPQLELRKASPGLMVVLCEGRRGEGFYVCGACGAGFRTRQSPHRTPQSQECHGTLEQVSLGQEFVTDVLQLQFLAAPQDGTEPVPFAFSLAYALVEGAADSTVLEVPSVDLSATVSHSDRHVVPPIVLYDNVPGGAGLVARLEKGDVLKACLRAALKRVEGSCGCAPETSCYGCLRNYRNQFAHQFLQRGAVHSYLSSLLSTWA